MSVRNIAYVLDEFPVLSETFVGGEMRQMSKLGVQVVPIVFDLHTEVAQPDDAALARDALAVTTLSDWPPLAVGPRRLRAALEVLAPLSGRKKRSVLRAAHKIARLAKSRGCQHVHSHFAWGAALHGITAAKLAGLSCSFSLHSGTFARNFLVPELIRPLLEASDCTICATEALRAEALTAGAKNARVVACGADLERFTRPAELPAHNGRLLSVGRLISQKGIDVVLGALALLPSNERPGLDIVGDGPERGALEDEANRLGLDVHFLGPRPSPWIAEHGPHYLALVTAFRRGTDGGMDSAPLVVKEAMAMGLPVITTRLSGIVDTVADTALLADMDDVETLAASIRRAVHMPSEVRSDLIACAEQRVHAHFSQRAQAAGVLAAIQEPSL